MTIEQLRSNENVKQEEIHIRFKEQKPFSSGQALLEDGKTHIMVCADLGCRASKGLEIMAELKYSVDHYNIADKVEVHQTGCFGLCEPGTNILVLPQGIYYTGVKLEDVEELVRSHLIEGQVVDRLLYEEVNPNNDESYIPFNDLSFNKKQKRIALQNCGRLDPDIIDEYIANDGYKALEKAIKMQPQDIIDIIKDSGLRGRGGAGFPTGLKWQFTKDTPANKKYVVCNADEGDPGAFMDRAILEGDPHSVLEAMAIAAKAIGSDEGYIYIRAEYPKAIERLEHSIKIAMDRKLLGENILGSNFSFNIYLKIGAGAFVCGEETALIESIEGKRGIPRNKPPFPANRGLWNKPTLINNVETYANIPQIINKGSDWFKSIGTEGSKGTKVFSLGGKVKHSGLIEIPMGTSFRDVVYEIGGGLVDGKKFKAIQTGGPSGGVIPEEYLDMPIDYESLKKLGSMMGSGGMIVIDEDTCIVDLVKFYLDFIVDESCGKCSPCRIGSKRLYELLDKITLGLAEEADLIELRQLGKTIKETSACGLGQSAPNPVLSTLEHFTEEYFEHVLDKKCRAHVCKGLIKYEILQDKCIGCTKCARNCPVSCITGSLKHYHYINQADCIKCGNCMEVCPVDAVVKI